MRGPAELAREEGDSAKRLGFGRLPGVAGWAPGSSSPQRRSGNHLQPGRTQELWDANGPLGMLNGAFSTKGQTGGRKKFLGLKLP